MPLVMYFTRTMNFPKNKGKFHHIYNNNIYIIVEKLFTKIIRHYRNLC